MYLLHKIYQNAVKQAPNSEKNGIFDLIYLKKVCTAILGILKTKGCAKVELAMKSAYIQYITSDRYFQWV